MLTKPFWAPDKLSHMSEPTRWEYATVPLLTHATKQILDQWGEDGWELVSVLPGQSLPPRPAGMAGAKPGTRSCPGPGPAL